MPYQFHNDVMAQGQLNAAIGSGDTSLTLRSGQGGRFPTIPSGAFIFATLIDTNETAYDRFEDVKVTAISTDTLTIERAQNGTSAKDFPITPGNNPNLVRVIVSTTPENIIGLAGGGYKTLTDANATIGRTDPRKNEQTPTADRTITLDNSFRGGEIVTFVNKASSFDMIIDANDSSAILTIPGGGGAMIMAMQDAPADSGDWRVLGLNHLALPDTLTFGGPNGDVTINFASDASLKWDEDRHGSLGGFVFDKPVTLDATFAGTVGTNTLVKDNIPKAWINLDGTGTVGINDSFNVSSVGDNGTGDYTVNWDKDFANTNYMITGASNSVTRIFGPRSGLATASADIGTADNSGTNQDVDPLFCLAFGDQ